MNIRITPEKMVYGGSALGRHEGQAVFVRGGIAGEEVEAEIVETANDYLVGQVSHILSPSPHRVEPRCSLFGICGGCHWQHIDYPAQLRFKEQILAEQLRRIGRFDGVTILPIIPMADPWHYRQKVRFGLRTVGERVSLGFYKTGTRFPIELEACPVMDSRILDVYKTLRDECARALKPFKGFCTVEMRSSVDGVQIMLNRSAHFQQSLKPVVEAARNSPLVKGFHHRFLLRDGPPGYTIDFGEKLISYQVDGLTFQLQPTSFFQVNCSQAERMFVKAMEMIDIGGGRILDAYCGAGVLTLMAARMAHEAVGVECVPSAVEDARGSALLNRIKNVKFIEGLFQDVMARLEGEAWHGVILDPPREGVADQNILRNLAEMGPGRILYISCNPTTLARDCWSLCQNGYTLDLVQPVDMFPHTYHIEAIALLERV